MVRCTPNKLEYAGTLRGSKRPSYGDVLVDVYYSSVGCKCINGAPQRPDAASHNFEVGGPIVAGPSRLSRRKPPLRS